MLLEINPYVTVFRHAFERISLEPHNNLQLVLQNRVQGTNVDRRVYSAPTGIDEVAAIIPHTEYAETNYRPQHIVVQERMSLEARNVSPDNCFVDPLTYVLIFPTGEPGYEHYIPHSSGMRGSVTRREFYAFRIMFRLRQKLTQSSDPIPFPYSVLHRSRFLFQQYVVDAYAKVEMGNLNYQRSHQRDL